MPRLAEPEILAALASVSSWQRQENEIRRLFQFKDFPAAIRFVNRIATSAEDAFHHPDIDIRWNKVRLTLTTHDESGLTQKDFDLARTIDQIFSGQSSAKST